MLKIKFSKKIIKTVLCLTVAGLLSSCFEEEQEEFYDTTVASIVADVDESSLTATFRDVHVADAGASFIWTFGVGTDGSNERIPSYTYPDEGEYEVTLEIVDSDGSTSSTTRTIEISDGVDTSADFSVSSVGTGLIDFTNKSEDSQIFLWDFGNGDTSINESPATVTYPTIGDYTITLDVESSHGAKDDTEQMITIGTGLELGNQLVLAETKLSEAEAGLEDAESDEETAAAEAEVAAAEAEVAAANNLTLVLTNTSIGMDSNYTFTISSVDLTSGSLTDIDVQVTASVDDGVMYTFTQAGDYIVTLLGTFTQLDSTVIEDIKEASITVNSDGVIID